MRILTAQEIDKARREVELSEADLYKDIMERLERMEARLTKLEQDELAISKNVDDAVDEIMLSRDE